MYKKIIKNVLTLKSDKFIMNINRMREVNDEHKF